MMKLKSKPNNLKCHQIKDITPRLPTIVLKAHVEEHAQTFTNDTKLVSISLKQRKTIKKNNTKYKQSINKFFKLLLTKYYYPCFKNLAT